MMFLVLVLLLVAVLALEGVILWRLHPRPDPDAAADLLDLARRAWGSAGLDVDHFSPDADVMATGKYADFLFLLTNKTGHPIRKVRDVLKLLED